MYRDLFKEMGLSVAKYVEYKSAQEIPFIIEPTSGVARVYQQEGRDLAIMDKVIFQVGSLSNMPWVMLYDDVIKLVLGNNPKNMVLRLCGKDDISYASSRLAGMDFDLYLQRMFGQIISRDKVKITSVTNDQNMARVSGLKNLQDVLTY